MGITPEEWVAELKKQQETWERRRKFMTPGTEAPVDRILRALEEPLMGFCVVRREDLMLLLDHVLYKDDREE